MYCSLNIRLDSRSFCSPDDLVQLRLNLVHLANRFLPLGVCDAELLLQLLEASLLGFRVVLEPRERGYYELDLLFLEHQVASELNLARLELFSWDWDDYAK
jgi:hypothetical protein